MKNSSAGVIIFAVFVIGLVLGPLIFPPYISNNAKSGNTVTTTLNSISTDVSTFTQTTPTVTITYVRLLYQGNYYNMTGGLRTGLNSYFSLVFAMQNNGISPSPSVINSISLSPNEFTAGLGNQQICVGSSTSACTLIDPPITGLFLSYPIGIEPMAGGCALPCTVPQNYIVEISMSITGNFNSPPYSGYSGPLTVSIS